MLTAELSGSAGALTHLVRYFATMMMYQHLLILLAFRGLMKSSPHLSKSSWAWDGYSGMKSLLSGFPARWQVLHPTTHSRASLYTVGYQNPASNIFCVVVSGPMCPPTGPSCASFNTLGISSSKTHCLRIWSGPILYNSPLISWNVRLCSTNFRLSFSGMLIGNCPVDRYSPMLVYHFGSITI